MLLACTAIAVVQSSATALPHPRIPSPAILFEADQHTNAVYAFDADDLQAPALTKITDGISNPMSIAVDPTGVLYVANVAGAKSWVSVYQPGSIHPEKKMRFRFKPESVVVASDRTLAIAGSSGFGKNGTLLFFDKGSPTPTRRITIPIGSDIAMLTMGIAFDASGDLLLSVGVYPHDSRIIEVAPGSTRSRIIGLTPGNGEGFDGNGQFYVGNPSNIVVYSPDFHSVVRDITNGDPGVTGLAVTADGRTFASNVFGDQGFIEEYGAGPNPIQMRQGSDTIYPTGVAYLPVH